jgi:hypothetical protein
MLSKFLLLGMPLDEVVARAGELEFVDNARTPRTGRSKLFAHASVMAGKLVRRTA